MTKQTKDPEVIDGTAAAPEVLAGFAVKKECPQCHTTMWQGPHLRGEIVNGKFVVLETLYACINHHVMPVEQMQDRMSPAYGL